MKTISFKSILLFLAIILSLHACTDFEELRINPNDPDIVPPSLLFTQVTPKPESSFSGTYRFSQYHNFIAADLGVSPPVNYRFGAGSFSYDVLRDIDRMAVEAEKTNASVYLILAKFLRAYYYIEMTRRLGDIPFSEAMKGAEIPQPTYDKQKTVYLQCLNWLDEVNTELGNYIIANPGAVVEGDIYYQGNLNKWQRAINAYTIRILLSLSKKADDAELNVKGRFENIVGNPDKYPLLMSIDDNMQIHHRDEDGFRGSYNPNVQIDVEGTVYADTYIDMLKAYQDPRLMKVADPTPKALAANPNETAVRADFNAYYGSDISLNLEQNGTLKANGEFSPPNAARFLNFTGQPSILIGYAEQELSIAEAAHLGWTSVDAKVHYEQGVGASMVFYGIDEGAIADYLENKAPYIVGMGGVTRIREQLYLALAENSGWESWFATRRTGVPAYKFSSINNIDRLPVRWAYPIAEDTDNHGNYRAALVSQFGAEVDDRDQIIWLLKD